jgi:hypothetical protein
MREPLIRWIVIGKANRSARRGAKASLPGRGSGCLRGVIHPFLHGTAETGR